MTARIGVATLAGIMATAALLLMLSPETETVAVTASTTTEPGALVEDPEAVSCSIRETRLFDRLYVAGLARGTRFTVSVGEEGFDQEFLGSSYPVQLAPREAGSEYPVNIDFEATNGTVRRYCGIMGTPTADELGVSCSVELYEGRPKLTVVGGGLDTFIRDGQDVGHLKTTFNSPVLDMAAEPGVHDYQVYIFLTDAGPQTIECGQIEVPPVNVEELIGAARDFRFADLAQYWTVSPVCPGCNFEPRTIVIAAGWAIEDTWDLPDEHPGIRKPSEVHEFLLEAIANGSEVTAKVEAGGQISAWTVDGYGLVSDCFEISSTHPDDRNEPGATEPGCGSTFDD